MLSKLMLSLLISGQLSLFQIQDNPGDSIVGVWVSEEENEEIEIYKSEYKYYGKIILSKSLFEKDGQTLRKDLKNPDVKLRNRTLLNSVILSHFEYESNEWINGELYDLRSGKTFSSIIKLKDKRLEIRSYVGISLFGRTTVWRRAG